jgi:hypothetical protein
MKRMYNAAALLAVPVILAVLAGGCKNAANNADTGDQEQPEVLVDDVLMNPNVAFNQTMATDAVKRAVNGLSAQNKIMKNQYSSLQTVENNIASVLQNTGNLDSGIEQVPGLVDALAAAVKSTHPDFLKSVETLRVHMNMRMGGYPLGQQETEIVKWQILAEQIGLDTNATKVSPADLTAHIAGMIPAGENGEKFPANVAQQMSDLCEFRSFGYSVKETKGYTLNY